MCLNVQDDREGSVFHSGLTANAAAPGDGRTPASTGLTVVVSRCTRGGVAADYVFSALPEHLFEG